MFQILSKYVVHNLEKNSEAEIEFKHVQYLRNVHSLPSKSITLIVNWHTQPSLSRLDMDKNSS